MIDFFTGLTKTIVKTAVGLPVTIVADVLTLGGELINKPGQTYTGDMLDSISNSLDEMTD